jgi:hypothetical protein
MYGKRVSVAECGAVRCPKWLRCCSCLHLPCTLVKFPLQTHADTCQLTAHTNSYSSATRTHTAVDSREAHLSTVHEGLCEYPQHHIVSGFEGITKPLDQVLPALARLPLEHRQEYCTCAHHTA